MSNICVENVYKTNWVLPAGTGVVSKQAIPAPTKDRHKGNRRPSFNRMKILSRIAGNSTAPAKPKIAHLLKLIDHF